MSATVGFPGYRTYERMVTCLNPHIEITLRMAHELKTLGDYAKALEFYDRVLRMNPHEARAHQAKGNIFDLMDRYEDALASFTTALECDPFNAETLHNKRVTLRKMGRKKERDECTFQEISWSL